MIAVIAAHVAVAVLVWVAGPRLGRNAFVLAAAAPLAALAWAASVAPGVLDGTPVSSSLRWVPSLELDLDLRVDAFGLLFVLLIAAIGVLVLWFASRYFGERADRGRIAAYLVLFAGAMLGVVTADNVVALYVFWELTSVTSFLLVGIDDRLESARKAARQAIIITGAGGLALLAGLVLLAQEAGTWELSAILADLPSGTVAGVAVALVLLGAITKSAQFPFHGWLPGAMAAPTPVSAYLHSATMVKAGVYLIARFAPAAAVVHEWWRPGVTTIGLVTMVFGGYVALRQTDLKLLLAYGTVSQLGFMVALFAGGTPELAFAGTAVVLAHAAFKAGLFLSVGTVDHEMGTRDIRSLTGVGRHLPVLAGAAVLCAASMAGIPPLLGFVAKEKGLEAVLDGPGGALAVAGIVAGSVLTVAYSARFAWGAFGGPVDPGARVHPPPGPLVAPTVLLAAVSVVCGLVPALATELVAPAAAATITEAGESSLALWHGLTAALGLSAVAIAGGAALFAARQRVEAAQARAARGHSAAERFDRGLDATITFADRVTGLLQNGSLPFYVAVTTAVAIGASAFGFAGAAALPDGAVPAENPLQAAVAAILVALAVAVAATRHRMAAAILLGGIGYGMVVLFAIEGAPDLALTQLLVETLSLVAFVFVFRHLPARFEEDRARSVPFPVRLGVALGTGIFVTAAALASGAARTAEPISGEFFERADEAGGRNIVNLILVDFRGFDTLGEITVLTVCIVGVASLVGAGLGRRRGTGGPDADRPPGDGTDTDEAFDAEEVPV